MISLSLSKNKITVIPDDISKLKKLRKLNLQRNRIKDLPESICTLVKLKTLHMSHNSIVSTTFPSSFSGLKNLTELSLDNNQLTQVPPQIYALPKLKKLALEANPLNKSYTDDFSIHLSGSATPTPANSLAASAALPANPILAGRRKSLQQRMIIFITLKFMENSKKIPSKLYSVIKI